MKKLLYILAIMLFISNAAFADFNNSSDYQVNQGFNGESAVYSVSTIKEVLNMYDEQIATIQGNIVKRLSKDKYLFKDKSGEMIVEIDYKYWAGLHVNEKDILQLTGKVDKDYNDITLDVFMVKKVK